MNELRKQIRSISTNIIKIYEDRLREASEKGEGVDLLGLNAECMEEQDKIDIYLSEFQERIKKKKKMF